MPEKIGKRTLERIRFLNNVFKKWEIELRKGNKERFVGFEEFLKVSKILSDFLPKIEDSSLFKIDHVLYPGQDWSDETGLRFNMVDSKKLFRRINIRTYFTAYKIVRTEYEGFDNILCDNTVLKVIKYIQNDNLCLYNTVVWLLWHMTGKFICMGMKLLKIVLKTNLKESYTEFIGMRSLILSFKGILTEISKDENNKEMTMFISELATECYAYFEEDYLSPKYKESAPAEENIIEIIHVILDDRKSFSKTDFFLNFLYDIFTSEKDEQMRCKYLEYFLGAIISSPYMRFLENGICALNYCLLKKINRTFYARCGRNKEMQIIDDLCGHNSNPYLPDVVVAIDAKKLWNDEVKAKDEKETDYTFEKFFYYDVVVKSLHLLTIFYTAYQMLHSLCMKVEFIGKDNSEEFRKDNYLKDYIGFYLNNPDLLVPWHIEKTLQMCPFLIFPCKQTELVIDLIKFLRGEEIPEMDKELSKKIEEMKAITCRKSLFKQDELLDHPKRPC